MRPGAAQPLSGIAGRECGVICMTRRAAMNSPPSGGNLLIVSLQQLSGLVARHD